MVVNVHIFGTSATLCSLHGFCDASAAAYAAVVYLCAGQDLCHFVASKTRVLPLTKQTIPRLELMSCLLLARLITHVLAALQPVIKVQLGLCFMDSKAGSRVRTRSGNNSSTIE